MTHRSKKPFECKFEGCDKSYCDARSLRRHLENTHQHEIDAATYQSQYGGGGGGGVGEQAGAANSQVRGTMYTTNDLRKPGAAPSCSLVQILVRLKLGSAFNT